ncbi:cyclic di-GMP phosphodiesterase response regulator RpfG [Abditibacteriota bacterium]|nr:cyclic di-GMP phosphodiesterase response regulator RpfG [Abditibacteriota bacterium]
MNVSRWRDAAPDFDADIDVPSTRSLEAWMNECATQATDATSVAGSLARAWRALLESSGATQVVASAVWVCVGEDGRLELLGRDGKFDDDNHESQTAVVASEQAWPRAPFWILEGEGAARDLALQLGLLSEQVAAPSLCVPMGEEGLALLWIKSEDGELAGDWRSILQTCANQGETLLSFALRLERMNSSLHGLAESVADAIDEREPHREGRSRAVAYYAALVAREMGLDEGEVAQIEFAALWHSMGRLSVPESVLNKDSALSDSELATVRASSEWGARKLEGVDGMHPIALSVRHQHERFDGLGSPDALRGEDIPIGARVLAVASRFAAMTGRRADRGPMSVVGGAMEDVAAASGNALDPEVVAAFLRAMGRSL